MVVMSSVSRHRAFDLLLLLCVGFLFRRFWFSFAASRSRHLYGRNLFEYRGLGPKRADSGEAGCEVE